LQRLVVDLQGLAKIGLAPLALLLFGSLPRFAAVLSSRPWARRGALMLPISERR
jgi:hypothetical protein